MQQEEIEKGTDGKAEEEKKKGGKARRNGPDADRPNWNGGALTLTFAKLVEI